MPRPSGARVASFDLARSNYLISTSPSAHRAPVGTFQLIMTRPWVLWRLISHVADAGGACATHC